MGNVHQMKETPVKSTNVGGIILAGIGLVVGWLAIVFLVLAVCTWSALWAVIEITTNGWSFWPVFAILAVVGAVLHMGLPTRKKG